MRSEAIAVVGMSCRFPQANGVDDLWEILKNGRDATSETPRQRYDLNELYSDVPRPGKVISRRSGYISDPELFDADFFGMSKGEASFLDPQQRLLMMVTAEAFEDAGMPLDAVAGTRTGVYIGNMHIDYWQLFAKRGLRFLSPSAIYNYASILSGRLSFTFDLRGPSISLDTACSSSLVAVHLACQALRTGDAEMALAGGVNLKLIPDEDVLLSQVRMLAPDGKCKFGDAGANGFAPSDGVGIVVLKTLSRALLDGDRIRGVILGSVTSNDGALSGSLLGPSAEAHAQMLRWAYENAGVSPSEVTFIEAHGTGTQMIDPIEVQALAQVLGKDRSREEPLLVGSVKTNIGHTEGAAGVAALIKTILCIENRLVVPSLHFDIPNPVIPWNDLPVRIPTRSHPLDRVRRVIAGISGQGISSANTHLVVGQAPASPPSPAREGTFGFRLSAQSPSALRDLAQAYIEYLRPEGRGRRYPLRDIAYSSVRGRRLETSSLWLEASSHDELWSLLRRYVSEGWTPESERKPRNEDYGPDACYVPLPHYAWQLKPYWLPDTVADGGIPPELRSQG